MSLLFTKRKIGNLEIKNRIIMPPMCMYKVNDNNGNPRCFHKLHYTSRALGGVGLIIVESTGVEPRGRLSNKDLGLWSDDQMNDHKELVEKCQKFGAKIAIQLTHAGRKSQCNDSHCVGPSPIAFSSSYETPHELNINEIKEIKNKFIASAKKAEEIGYDAIEIQAAHGFLFHSFLSPLSNLRKDEYGGSFEKRIKLLIEVIQEIKKEISIPIMVRISATEWEKNGWDINDSIKLCIELEKNQVDCIHVSAGGGVNAPSLMPKITPLYQALYAKAIKEKINIPVIAVGLITKASEGEALLLGDVCDFVSFGRELLRNPNFPQYAMREFQENDLIEKPYIRAFN